MVGTKGKGSFTVANFIPLQEVEETCAITHKSLCEMSNCGMKFWGTLSLAKTAKNRTLGQVCKLIYMLKTLDHPSHDWSGNALNVQVCCICLNLAPKAWPRNDRDYRSQGLELLVNCDLIGCQQFLVKHIKALPTFPKLDSYFFYNKEEMQHFSSVVKECD